MPSKKQTKTPTKKSVKKSPANKIKDELKVLKVALSESEEKFIRLKAEFDNFRKRKEKETISLLKYEG